MDKFYKETPRIDSSAMVLSTTIERESWAEGSPLVSEWLKPLRPSTRRQYLMSLQRFYQWLQSPENGGELAGKSLGEILEFQERAVGRDKYKLVDLVQRWIQSWGPRARGTKAGPYSAIRSFFAYNRVELPRDARFRIRPDYPVEPGEMSVQDFRLILGTANVMYRAVFLVMFMGAMGEEEFLAFNRQWEYVGPQVRAGESFVKVRLPGRKKARDEAPYYTFISGDALDALKRYLSEVRGEPRIGEAIFLTDKGTPVSARRVRSAFTEASLKAGVIKRPDKRCPKCGGAVKRIRRPVTPGSRQRVYKMFLRCLRCGETIPFTKEYHLSNVGLRYRVHVHEMRDLFRTEWQKSGADPFVAEYLLGHEVDPNRYNKFYHDVDYVRGQYLKARPYLNVLSQDPRVVPRTSVEDLERKVAALDAENRKLRESQVSEKEVEDLRSELERLRAGRDTQIEELQRGLEELRKMIINLMK
jgi:hypothetical protein